MVRTYLKKNLSAPGGVAEQLKMLIRHGGLRFFDAQRLARNPNLYFEIGSIQFRVTARIDG